MKFSKFESHSDYLCKEYGVPSVLEVVGKRFVFIFQLNPDEITAIAGTITGAILEYPLNSVPDPEDAVARLDLSIQAPDIYVQNKRCMPKEITAWMYADDLERDEERLRWMLYVFSSPEKYMDGDNDEAFEGEFRLLD